MTGPDDPFGDMGRHLTPFDADRLLSGDLAPEELPDHAAGVARLLTSLRGSDVHTDPVREHHIVSGMVNEIRAANAAGPAPQVVRLRRRIPTKASAAALVAVLATGTAAAAANGSLPAGVQQVVSHALEHVDISVPLPGTHAGGANAGKGRASDGTPPAKANGPDASGSAARGLCTAASHTPPTNGARRNGSVAAANLKKAAAAAGLSVVDFCKQADADAPGNGKRGGTTVTSVVTPTVPGGNNAHGSTPTRVPHGPPVTKPDTGPPVSNPGQGKGNSTETTPTIDTTTTTTRRTTETATGRIIRHRRLRSRPKFTAADFRAV